MLREQLQPVVIVAAPRSAKEKGSVAPFPVVSKSLAIDILPLMRATNGWTLDKLQGFAVTKDGIAYVVTDNDGVDEAATARLSSSGWVRSVEGPIRGVLSAETGFAARSCRDGCNDLHDSVTY